MPVTKYPISGASLIINGKHITTNYRSCIKNVVMEPIHLEYFLEKYNKHKITAATYNSICWRGIGRARKNLTIDENVCLTKFMNGWLYVGHQKGHMKDDASCKGC